MERKTTAFHVTGDKHEFDPARWKRGPMQGSNGTDGTGLPKRQPETGIDTLIVGAGVGGLMTALECWRKGHNVVSILERNDGPVYTGDIIVIQPSAVAVLRHWPEMQAEFEREQVHAAVSYERHSGEHIYGPTVPSFNDEEHRRARQGPFVAPAQVRRTFFRMLLRQVARLGLAVEYGQRVAAYWEDEAAGQAGVVLAGTGARRAAHVVVAADGLRSTSETIVAGGHAPVRPSGMSIYRTAYPRELAMKDETVRRRWGDSPPVWEYWLGPGMYMGVFISADVVSWGFTPRDAQDRPATESWEPDTDPELVVGELARGAADWDPAIAALVRTAPPGAVVHWPLLWRPLRARWTSAGGRVVQVGDSAHSFTPTSGNGATQALEDAITLAACLQLGGGVPGVATATAVYTRLRYERVSCAQKLSFVNAQLKTATDWAAVARDPARVRTRFPRWIFQHDPEAYAYEKYGLAFASVVAGAPFRNTNIPPGHEFAPWTIEEVLRDIEQGKRIEDFLDGDWS